jgi:hypothetical protein
MTHERRRWTTWHAAASGPLLYALAIFLARRRWRETLMRPALSAHR